MDFPWRQKTVHFKLTLFSLVLIANLVHCKIPHGGGASIQGILLTVKTEFPSVLAQESYDLDGKCHEVLKQTLVSRSSQYLPLFLPPRSWFTVVFLEYSMKNTDNVADRSWYEQFSWMEIQRPVLNESLYRGFEQ